MPGIATHLDPSLFSDVKAGDEQAFHRLFSDCYTEMLGEAKSLLHEDGASAGRAVEQVFIQVWKQREEFANEEALDAYLHDALHEAAARVTSRHVVAHHLGRYGNGRAHAHVPKPAPGADEAWAAVSNALFVNSARAAAHAQEAADQSRHDTARHLAEIAKPKSRAPMLATAVVLTGAFAAFAWWMARDREDAILTARLAAPEARSMTTVEGQISYVTLAERSTARLGPDTKLVIPRGFGSSVRGLKLEGTATFTVAPDQKRRFTVRAGNASVVAAGTQFTVRAYPDEGDVTVHVRSGDVIVTLGDSVLRLAAGAAVVVTRDGAMKVRQPSEVEQATGWADGFVVVADRPLREVLAVARRWFALDLFVADTALLSRRVTLSAPVESQSAAIASIESSGQMVRVWQGGNMVLRARRR
jgi:ferric-dicitrate binding protein FerR (iron transport regulator)